ncbi:MAG: PIN domain-containing protein [Deltaproteobacteria bacterium]|nr:PIN domain-containing protein [Deltaproteobacteria bacterium]
MTIAKSVRISKKGQFVIPKEMREAMGVKEGEEILVTFEEGKVILTRPQEYARKTRGLLKGTWLSGGGASGVGMKRNAWKTKLGELARVGVDSSVLIYHLEDIPRYADLTETVFTALMDGSLRAILSTLSITEILAGPFAKGQPHRIAAFEQFLFSLPSLDLVPPSYTICREAARLRAKYRIRTPDAILLATSLNEKAEAFLTNDARLGVIKEDEFEIVQLNDFIDP